MSDPVRPATWEEVERLRQCYARPPDAAHFTGLLVCLGPHLLALIDQMAGLLHDARQEPGYLLGRAEMQQEVLELLTEKAGQRDEKAELCEPGGVMRPLHKACAAAFRDAAEAVASHSAPAWTPPPAVLREENERLREALRMVFAAVADYRTLGTRGVQSVLNAVDSAQKMTDSAHPR